jgi:hypothetical protein
MGKPWFDPETGVLMLDDYITSLPSYEKYVADGIITPAEVAEQAQNLAKSLKKLEQSLRVPCAIRRPYMESSVVSVTLA